MTTLLVEMLDALFEDMSQGSGKDDHYAELIKKAASALKPEDEVEHEGVKGYWRTGAQGRRFFIPTEKMTSPPRMTMVWSDAAKKLASDKDLNNLIMGVATKVTKGEAERDDVVQDFFVKKFGLVLAAAAKGLEAGKYSASQFKALVTVAVKNVADSRRKSAKSAVKTIDDFSTIADKGKNKVGRSEKDDLTKAVKDVINKQADEKGRKFLKTYFGLDKEDGPVEFIGMKLRDALRKAGLADEKGNVDNKTQIWATRQVSAAMAALRDNPAVKAMAEQKAKNGHKESKLFNILEGNENPQLADAVFLEWFKSVMG